VIGILWNARLKKVVFGLFVNLLCLALSGRSAFFGLGVFSLSGAFRQKQLLKGPEIQNFVRNCLGHLEVPLLKWLSYLPGIPRKGHLEQGKRLIRGNIDYCRHLWV